MKRAIFIVSMAAALLAGCERRAELAACDIGKADCQDDVFYAVMRMRGDGWDPFQGVPPILTITVDSYRKQLQDQAQKAKQDAAAQAANGQDQTPQVNPWDVTLQLLSLVTVQTTVAQAQIDDSVSNVAAYYSSDVQKVTVLDRHEKSTWADDTALLAHELVHAFQDREHTLSTRSDTIDGSFADQALIEGEAVLYQYLARVEIDNHVPQNIDWHGFYHGMGDGLRDAFSTEPSPYYAVSWFVYPYGGDLMINAWLRGGNASVRRLNSDVPRNAHEIMARYAGSKATTPDTFSCRPKAPSDAFSFYASNRMGAMQLYGFLSGQHADSNTAYKTGLRWRGDQIWLYFDMDSQHVAVGWRIRTADSATADAIVAAANANGEADAENQLNLRSQADDLMTSSTKLAKGPDMDAAVMMVATLRAQADHIPPKLSVEREGNDVRIVASDDPDVRDNWQGPTDCDK